MLKWKMIIFLFKLFMKVKAKFSNKTKEDIFNRDWWECALCWINTDCSSTIYSFLIMIIIEKIEMMLHNE